MKNNNPAQDGIEAAKSDAKKREDIEVLCDKLKLFCIDSIDESRNFSSDLEYIAMCLEVFRNCDESGDLND